MTINTKLNAPRELSLDELTLVSGGVTHKCSGDDTDCDDLNGEGGGRSSEFQQEPTGGGETGGTGSASGGPRTPSSQDYFDASQKAGDIATGAGVAGAAAAGAEIPPLTLIFSSVAGIFGITSLALRDAGQRLKTTEDACLSLVAR